MNQNLEECIAKIFGNPSKPFEEKFQRRREYLKKITNQKGGY